MRFIFVIFYLGFNSFLYSQAIDLKKLDSEIEQDIINLQYQKAQKKLHTVLKNESISSYEKTKVLIILASTYRSIEDYPTCINYLLDAKSLSLKVEENDSLKQKINAKLALAYFDANRYEDSYAMMKQISSNDYKNLELRDKAYIIMQEGFLLKLEGKYVEAEKKYNNSLEIIQNIAPCHRPVIEVKKMELLALQNKVAEAENLYNEIIKAADNCKILKYKIYATEQIKFFFERNNNLQKAGYYSKLLTQYTTEYRRDQKLSNLHLDNINYLEQKTKDEEKKSLTISIIYIISCIVFLGLIFFLIRKSYVSNKEKQKIEQELQQKKTELSEFITSQHKLSDSKNLKEERDVIPHFDRLTKRQKELLQYMTEGLTNKEIGAKLFISESTVKYHISKIYELLELKNRKEFLKKYK